MKTKTNQECLYDIVSLGEVMLRLDPGNHRVRTARRFDVWEGGGEYNVARGLSRCFGLRAAVVTSLVDNDIGRLVENLMLAGGVEPLIHWQQFDGVGRAARNGLNFTERGFGWRGAKGISDRGHTAISQLTADHVDWNHLFGELGVRWFHTGGIFAGLSSTTPNVIMEAMTAARGHGTRISYDLNYRSSLWEQFGGIEACQEVNRRIAPLVDVMIGNEEDFVACLGMEVAGVDENLNQLPTESYKTMMEKAKTSYPNFEVIATTLRGVNNASINDWGALCWHDGEIYEATQRNGMPILDRVGGGDSFASGLIFGLMDQDDIQLAVELGAAHGALAMTTPGDTSMATKEEVFALVEGRSARVRR